MARLISPLAAAVLALVVAAPSALALERNIFEWASPPGPGTPTVAGGEFPFGGSYRGTVCGTHRGRVDLNTAVPPSAATPDGSRIFFSTSEQLVPSQDGDATFDIYEYSAGTTKLVSVGGADHNYLAGCSADGSKVFFATRDVLDGADTETCFDLYERSGGQTRLATVDETPGDCGFTQVRNVAISSDGNAVAWETDAPETSDDSGNTFDVFVRAGNDTKLVSSTAASPDDALIGGVSPDGTRVYFDTKAALTAADTDTFYDVYSGAGGAQTLESAGASTTQDANYRWSTADGAHVFFRVGPPASSNSELYRRGGGATERISAPAPGGSDGTFAQFGASSPDGTLVYFTTEGRLLPEDNDGGLTDVYLRRPGGADTGLEARRGGGRRRLADRPKLRLAVLDTGVRLARPRALLLPHPAAAARRRHGHGQRRLPLHRVHRAARPHLGQRPGERDAGRRVRGRAARRLRDRGPAGGHRSQQRRHRRLRLGRRAAQAGELRRRSR